MYLGNVNEPYLNATSMYLFLEFSENLKHSRYHQNFKLFSLVRNKNLQQDQKIFRRNLRKVKELGCFRCACHFVKIPLTHRLYPWIAI